MDAVLETDADAQSNLDRSPSSMTVEDIFHTYSQRVYNVARRMVGNDDEAEDVTQDVLLQVVRKLPTFRGESALPTWLHRVTVNAALQHRRKKAVREEAVTHHSEEGMLEEGAPRWEHARVRRPEDQLEDREARSVIARAIRELPESYRKVFVLSEVEGQPNAEIGKRLSLSLAAVKSRLHRARAMMRDALTPYFEEPLP